jgi:predicted house-cleaning noncanonical NTP pyrophosphatase (MazG superfamily)
MESTIIRNSDSKRLTASGDNVEYRKALRKQLDDEVKKIIDVEMQKATLEIMEEHKKAMRQTIEDYRFTIRQIVEEEKSEIWKKAVTIKKFTLQLGI